MRLCSIFFLVKVWKMSFFSVRLVYCWTIYFFYCLYQPHSLSIQTISPYDTIFSYFFSTMNKVLSLILFNFVWHQLKNMKKRTKYSAHNQKYVNFIVCTPQTARKSHIQFYWFCRFSNAMVSLILNVVWNANNSLSWSVVLIEHTHHELSTDM